MDYDIDYNVTFGMSFLEKQKFLNQLLLEENFIINDDKRAQDIIKHIHNYWDPYINSKYINNILYFEKYEQSRRNEKCKT